MTPPPSQEHDSTLVAKIQGMKVTHANMSETERLSIQNIEIDVASTRILSIPSSGTQNIPNECSYDARQFPWFGGEEIPFELTAPRVGAADASSAGSSTTDLAKPPSGRSTATGRAGTESRGRPDRESGC